MTHVTVQTSAVYESDFGAASRDQAFHLRAHSARESSRWAGTGDTRSYIYAALPQSRHTSLIVGNQTFVGIFQLNLQYTTFSISEVNELNYYGLQQCKKGSTWLMYEASYDWFTLVPHTRQSTLTTWPSHTPPTPVIRTEAHNLKTSNFQTVQSLSSCRIGGVMGDVHQCSGLCGQAGHGPRLVFRACQCLLLQQKINAHSPVIYANNANLAVLRSERDEFLTTALLSWKEA